MFHTEHDYDIPLQPIKSKQKLSPEELRAIERNERASLAVSYFESINFTTIYTLFMKEIWQTFLQEFGKYILFPIAALGSALQAILAWREAWLNKGKSRSIVRAVVETVAAVAITTAVIGGLAAAAIFGAITPIIFAVVTASKAVFHAGSAIYYEHKSRSYDKKSKSELDPEKSLALQQKKEKYHAFAKHNGIAAAAGAVALVAVIGVFVLGKAVVAGVGIVVSIFGVGMALYKAMVQDDKPKVEKNTLPVEEKKLSEGERPDNTLRPEHKTKPVPILYDVAPAAPQSPMSLESSTSIASGLPRSFAGSTHSMNDAMAEEISKSPVPKQGTPGLEKITIDGTPLATATMAGIAQSPEQARDFPVSKTASTSLPTSISSSRFRLINTPVVIPEVLNVSSNRKFANV